MNLSPPFKYFNIALEICQNVGIGIYLCRLSKPMLPWQSENFRYRYILILFLHIRVDMKFCKFVDGRYIPIPFKYIHVGMEILPNGAPT